MAPLSPIATVIKRVLRASVVRKMLDHLGPFPDKKGIVIVIWGAIMTRTKAPV